MSRWRHAARSAWLGFALAALLLYPLAVALDSDPFFMLWRRRDLVETLAALALLWTTFAAGAHALWRRPGRSASFALACLAALPVLSLLAGLLRLLPFEDALIAAWQHAPLRVGLPVVIASGGAWLFATHQETFGRWLRRGLLAVSFVAPLVVFVLASAATAHDATLVIERQPSAARPANCSTIVALLFDELSFAYLYEGEQVAQRYPALRALSAAATNYLAVRAPAAETLVSVPSYLAARRLDDVRVDGLRMLERRADGSLAPLDLAARDAMLPAARRAGLSIEVGGYYLPYCDLLASTVDRCRAFSFYNTSTVADGFSPLHPLSTAFIMWPRQFPFGLVKNLPFARHQRALTDAAAAFAASPLPADRPALRLVHFSVPHLPFVFTRDGYHPPFNPLRTSPDEAYERQLGYVDTLIGRLLDGLRRAGRYDTSTIVVFADHGFRFGGRERDPLHVPFIVKYAGQTGRVDERGGRDGETLLRDIVTQTCR